MATQAEIDAAAKAIWNVQTAHDQFAASWDTIAPNDKVTSYAYATAALSAAEKVRAES